MDTQPITLVGRVPDSLVPNEQSEKRHEGRARPLFQSPSLLGPEPRLWFLLFFVSGFSGLAYQIIWTRMAFAAFGILTPVLSVVISVFMLGLGLGSWFGGRAIGPLTRKTGWPAVRFYALAELAIGAGAFAVPKLFALGQRWLLATGQSDSFTYLALSALVLALSIVPWCVCMGTTFPWMMAHVRSRQVENLSSQSFSYLYLANVLGALCGALLPAFVMIELFGFHDTLRIAALGNLFVAAMAWRLSAQNGSSAIEPVPADPDRELDGRSGAASQDSPLGESGRMIKWILFTTGFISMSMEVVWTRWFAPVLKSQVYSFALVLAGYLAATFFGSWLYRRDLRRQKTAPTTQLLAWLAVLAFLPVLANQQLFIGKAWTLRNIDLRSVGILISSLCPFCAILGYLSPSLVDRYSGGCPARAGHAYAVNVLGCILGPLFVSYLVLPRLDERGALIMLALPLVLGFVVLAPKLAARQRLGFGLSLAAVFLGVFVFSSSFEDYVRKIKPPLQLRRDYAATVISCGTDFDRALLVNGRSMTALSPAPKFMVHLPMALHQDRPQSALIICFGMGTSFRSALSWGARTTAVELSPSVRDSFGYFHADASQVLENPNGHVVVDDGRRYLQRSRDTYDVIVIDPPPPVEAAGSSLLYSKEFYDAAKLRLNPGGILQAWIPERHTPAFSAALRTLCNAFPYVQCFVPLESDGMHMLAAMQPIPAFTPAQMLSRMPELARKDAVEWISPEQLSVYLGKAFSTQLPGQRLLDPKFQTQITDDRPFNEYFLLRELGRL